MARPVIGICTALERARWSVWDQQAYLLPRSYVDAVQREGGIALLLPPDETLREDPDAILDLLDGLILAGGADIDPEAYGEQAHAETRGTVPERDDFEIALTRRALERDLPLLGICRGMQVMNVAAGGTLLQHLPESHGHHEHRRTPGSFDGADHDVRLSDGSLAARAAGEIVHGTKSHHHQARRSRSARASRSPAGRRSTSCPRPSRLPTVALRSASSGIPRPTSESRLIGALVAEAAAARNGQR